MIFYYGALLQGRIVSVPEHPRAVVPIQIRCQENISSSELADGKVQVFKSLCRHVLNVVNSSETFPLGMMKYQHNFCLLLQEVLSTTHVFTHDEKIFLGAYIGRSVVACPCFYKVLY